jgi:subtilisin family serine protease
MSKVILFFVFVLIILGFVSGIEDVDFSENGKVRMIVRNPTRAKAGIRMTATSTPVLDGKVKSDLGDRLSVEVSLEELEELKVRGIDVLGEDKLVHAFLQDSVGIVGANTTWGLGVSGLSVNGSNVAVCVIDTGVDSSHPDLAGKVLDEYCYCSAPEGVEASCCPNNLSEDNNASDNSGHGTHVAGIVAAGGGIDGIARGANIVAVKVLNSSGVGLSSDIKLGIEWCTNDTLVNLYNISVISLSLGNGQYDNSADCVAADAVPDITSAINAAWAKNISVVVATGNTGGGYTNATAGISSPACLGNTTKVTASDKADNYASYAFRHASFQDILVAPGSSINSTDYGGGYQVDSGTSMSAPMVSGAIAVIKQYLGLSGQVKTPDEISGVLNSTGAVLDDSSGSGYNFSRIDVYSAVLSLDVDDPDVALVSPENNTVITNVNHTFVCNFTDWQLENVTLNVWNSSGLFYNETGNLSGFDNESSFNVTNMSEGFYFWNCLAVDELGNSASASVNFSLIIGGLSTMLVSPVDGSYDNVDTNFSCRVISDGTYVISNVTFYLWNASDLIYNLTENISGVDNTSVFNYSFVDDGSYSWNCLGVNNVSGSSWGDFNYSFVFDSVDPVISSLSSGNPGDTDAEITWNTNETANSSAHVSGGSWSNSSSYVTSHSIDVSELAPDSTYTYSVTSCDRAGNCASDSGSFVTDAASVAVTSGGSDSSSSDSGSDGSSEPAVYEVGVDDIEGGYTKRLGKYDKIEFNISEGDQHSLTVDDVGDDWVELTIESESASFRLGVGQSAKLNLTSLDYYDLLVRLNAIVDDEAELTIKLINESIDVPLVDITGSVIEEGGVDNYLQVGAILVVILVLVFYIVSKIDRKKLKGLNNNKNNGKGKKVKA